MQAGEPKTEISIKQFPTGETKKLSELVSRRWKDHLLLFSRVKNKVIKVNPNFTLPFNLEEGKPSPLGVFSQTAFTQKPENLPEGKYAVEFLPGHKRSALLGRALFADKEGRIYRDIEVKGIGFLSTSPYPGETKAVILEPGKLRHVGRDGLLDMTTAMYDYEFSEIFSRKGVRTSRTLAIIELEELIFEGKKYSLDQLRKSSIIIDKDFNPVIEVRGFGTRARISDIEQLEAQHMLKETSDLLLEDAKKIVAQELGKETLSNEEYLQWFAKALGQNVGLIHRMGFLHNFLHEHNITLDCRIVDFDGVTNLSKDNATEDYNQELNTLKKSLKILFQEVTLIDTDTAPSFFDFLLKIFQESYSNTFPLEKRRNYLKVDAL